MKWDEFRDQNRCFVVVCFIGEDDLQLHRKELEALGKEKNVRLVVQPCPYEGLEFLFRIEGDLFGHLTSIVATLEKDLFWKALILRGDTDKAVIDQVSQQYHAYFCAVLEQDQLAVKAAVTQLERWQGHFA